MIECMNYIWEFDKREGIFFLCQNPDSDYHILSLKRIGSQQNPIKSIKGKDSPDSDYYIFFL